MVSSLRALPDDVPRLLICPLSERLLRDPVFCLADGHTYEKSRIESYIRKTRTTPFSPSGHFVNLDCLIPNKRIRDILRRNRAALIAGDYLHNSALKHSLDTELAGGGGGGGGDDADDEAGEDAPSFTHQACVVVEMSTNFSTHYEEAKLHAEVYDEIIRVLTSAGPLPLDTVMFSAPASPGSFEISVITCNPPAAPATVTGTAVASSKTAAGPRTATVDKVYSRQQSCLPWPGTPQLADKITRALRRARKRGTHPGPEEEELPAAVRSHLPLREHWSECSPVGAAPKQDKKEGLPGRLLAKSMAVWVAPEIDGELMPPECAPPRLPTLRLSEVLSAARVHTINFRQCKLNFCQALEIARFIARTKTLTTIALRENELDAYAGTSIAVALRSVRGVTSLDLRGNQIGPSGGTAIAQMLQANSSITQLNVFANKIGPEGGAAFASALQRNRTLRTLDLGDNCVGDQSATLLANALRGTTSLSSLQLQPLNDLHSGTPGLGHPASISGFSAVTNILKGNRTLNTVNLGASSVLSQWDADARVFPHKVMLQGMADPAADLCRTRLHHRPTPSSHSLATRNPDDEFPGQEEKRHSVRKQTLDRLKAYRRPVSCADGLVKVHQLSLQRLMARGDKHNMKGAATGTPGRESHRSASVEPAAFLPSVTSDAFSPRTTSRPLTRS